MNVQSLAPAPSFAYIETTIPAGMTVADYRHALPAKPSRLARLVGGLRRDRSAAPAPSPASAPRRLKLA